MDDASAAQDYFTFSDESGDYRISRAPARRGFFISACVTVEDLASSAAGLLLAHSLLSPTIHVMLATHLTMLKRRALAELLPVTIADFAILGAQFSAACAPPDDKRWRCRQDVLCDYRSKRR